MYHLFAPDTVEFDNMYSAGFYGVLVEKLVGVELPAERDESIDINQVNQHYVIHCKGLPYHLHESVYNLANKIQSQDQIGLHDGDLDEIMSKYKVMNNGKRRVYALLGQKGNKVSLFGFGTYTGDPIHPEFGMANPQIELDNGDIVWGIECWWGPEEEFYNQFKNTEISIVDINQERLKQPDE